MNEKERAARLAYDLDQRLQAQQAYTEQTAPEDRPLLRLADQLAAQSPLAPTAPERARLHHQFEQLIAAVRTPMLPSSFARLLKPTLNAALWLTLLVGIFAITVVLITNLLGKPSHSAGGPAQNTPMPAQPSPTVASTRKPVSMTLDQALALVQNPTWSTLFLEYQFSWHVDGKNYSFYKQAWIDKQAFGRVVSSDQVEGAGPRTPEIKPAFLSIYQIGTLKAVHLPSGDPLDTFSRSIWRVTPLENAGAGMQYFFPAVNNMDQTGPLTLDPFEDEIAGRPALVIRGKDVTYWFDRETGLLLRLAFVNNLNSTLTVKSVVYGAALPAEFDPADGLEKATFVNTPPPATDQTTPSKVTFQKQSQTVNGLRIDLRRVEFVGSSVRATLCYQPPSDGAWRLEGVELKTEEPNQTLPFYPASSTWPKPNPDGFICEPFMAAHPGISPTGTWMVTARRLLVPRTTTPDCATVNQQLSAEFPGLTVKCDGVNVGFGFSIDQILADMDMQLAHAMAITYIDHDVRGGPWVFPVEAGQIKTMIAAGGPISPVVVPSSCDPDTSRLGTQRGGPLDYHARMTGQAGLGTAQSGNFTFLLALACDPNFTRLMTGGDYYSEINGLGVLWTISYQGQPINGQVKHFSGIEPFVAESGAMGAIDSNGAFSEYIGLHVPETARPDFTPTDVRLRYVLKVQTPDGKIEGAALAFTLQRAIDGYRPVDITVEPISADEKQTTTSDPNTPLPFPTLPAPANPVSADTQALLDLLANWQRPILANPGWIHLRTRTEMPRGADLYAGLKEYVNEDWFQINTEGQVVTMIHIDHRLDGTVLQQTVSQNGKSTNLTFGGDSEFKPYPLDLAYAVKDTLKAGEQVKWTETTINGKPAVLLVLSGMFTRRDAIDAASGAWLYTETVTLQPGDDPFTGGSLETRTTLEAAEHVDAPPAEALALLGKTFTNYTPPAHYGTPAPQGFDPARSKLPLHNVQGDDFNAPTFWYGDISTADGYLLGRVDFGFIPGGWCDRSADGSKLAFSYTKADKNGSVISNNLRWFDLRDFNALHQPAPEIVNLGVLSWSPTQQKLAVFGCKADQQGCGLYLLDPAADSVRLLLPDVYANWQPIWSPDGRQIAFVDMIKQTNTLYVVDIETGQIAYQGKFNADAWQVPADSPTNTWGVTFPRDSSGSRCFEQK